MIPHTHNSTLLVSQPQCSGVMETTGPSPMVFTALLSGNVKQLVGCSEHDLRPFLPSLARMILSPIPVSMTTKWEGKRKIIHMLVSGMSEVNALREYLALNFTVS